MAQNGTCDETIMEISGHVSRQMLSRYAHMRTEAEGARRGEAEASAPTP